MISYTGFVKEIERLVGEAKTLRSAPKMHLEENFRRWRHELVGVLSQITQIGYLLPGSVRVQARSFGDVSNDRFTEAKKLKLYIMEMSDTINELQFIIDSYEKHGEPPKATQSKALKNGWPDKVTLSGLYHHAPISLWFKVTAIGIAIFMAGVYVGENDIYRKGLELFRTPPAVSNAR